MTKVMLFFEIGFGIKSIKNRISRIDSKKRLIISQNQNFKFEYLIFSLSKSILHAIISV